MPFYEVELQLGPVRTQILRAGSMIAAVADAEQRLLQSSGDEMCEGEVLSIRRIPVRDSELSRAQQVLSAVDDEGWYDASLEFLPWSFYKEQLPRGSEERAIEVMIKAWAGDGISMKLRPDPEDVSSVHVVQDEGICWVLTTNDNMSLVDIQTPVTDS